ncbi:hypothetical protein ACSMXM_11935 [Pacificimonas sp. ICDLI1SI03]
MNNPIWGGTMRLLLRRCVSGKTIQVFLGAAISVGLTSGQAQAQHQGAWSDAREIEALAVNVDKAVQACGLHMGGFDPRKSDNDVLVTNGISLSSDAPEDIQQLASSALGTSRYHRWLDPHAEIWLIAASKKPACRIAISGSEWASQIGDRLDALVQVGNFWRPASEGEIPFSALEEIGATKEVYFIDTPDHVPVRPMLIIATPTEGITLRSDQEMIITAAVVNKN